jgi:Domain of unknown function (DUF5679)
MRRAFGAVGAIIAAAVVIERVRALNSSDGIQRNLTRLRKGSGDSSQQGPEAYCLSCKCRRQIDNPQTLLMKNGRSGTRGSCPVCGKGLFLAGSKAA